MNYWITKVLVEQPRLHRVGWKLCSSPTKLIVFFFGGGGVRSTIYFFLKRPKSNFWKNSRSLKQFKIGISQKKPEKSCIRDTTHLSTNADSSTDTKKILKPTETESDGQKPTLMDRNGMKRPETGREKGGGAEADLKKENKKVLCHMSHITCPLSPVTCH